jgi:hypothetical protein
VGHSNAGAGFPASSASVGAAYRRRERADWPPWIAVAIAVVALVGFLSPPPIGLDLGGWAAPNSGGSNSGLVAANTLSGGGTICGLGSRISSAVDILQAGPTEAFTSGAQLSVGYEYEVVNYTASQAGDTVTVPVTEGLFPLTTGSSAQVSIPASTSTISGPGWSSEVSAFTVAASSLTFKATPLAQWTSEGYYTTSPVSDAVQASAPYGNLTLEFRWQWQLTEPSDIIYTSPWTVPSYTAANPGLPSIFYPAPTVTPSAMTSSVAMGQNFTEAISGYVEDTTFTLSFQTTTGTVLGSTLIRTPASVTGPLTVALSIVAASGELSAGWYIFHIQDRCGALVQDTWFHVTYASSVSVGVSLVPGSCGPLLLSGSGYASGAIATIAPSATPVSLIAPACASNAFAGWLTSGGLVVTSPASNATTVLVSWGGTITAKYGLPAGITFSETGLASGEVWNVTLSGTTESAVAPQSIVFTEPIGSYSYVITSTTPGDFAPYQGTIAFGGSPVTVDTAFTPLNISHVILIYMENQDLSTILQYASYPAYLYNTYGHATEFYPVCHDSLPDYTSATSGRYYVCDGSIPESWATDLPDELQAAGLSWMGYFESMPTACDRSWLGTIYDPTHNPFLVDADIVQNTSRCDAHDVNSAAFNTTIAEGVLPSFSLYIPNTQDDCEYSKLPTCNAWLASFLGSILNTTNPAERAVLNHTAIFVAWDEGLTDLGYSVGGIVNPWCQSVTGQALTVCGGHTFLTVVSPFSLGAVDNQYVTDYSIESTIEWLLGVGGDGGLDDTANFPAMTSLFEPS